MTQYAIVVHDLSKDHTRYHGPYIDNEWQEYYKEINSFYSLFDFINVYVIEMSLWPEDLINPNEKSEVLDNE